MLRALLRRIVRWYLVLLFDAGRIEVRSSEPRNFHSGGKQAEQSSLQAPQANRIHASQPALRPLNDAPAPLTLFLTDQNLTSTDTHEQSPSKPQMTHAQTQRQTKKPFPPPPSKPPCRQPLSSPARTQVRRFSNTKQSAPRKQAQSPYNTARRRKLCTAPHYMIGMSSVSSSSKSPWGKDILSSIYSPSSSIPPTVERTPNPEHSGHWDSLAGWRVPRDSSTASYSVAAAVSAGISSSVVSSASSVISSASSIISSASSAASSSAASIISSASSVLSSAPSAATPSTATASSASTPVPIKVHNIIVTHLTTTMTWPRFNLRLWPNAHTALASTTPSLWASLVLSVPLVLYAAWLVTRSRTFTAYLEARTRDARARQTFPSLWNTRDHWVLSSLMSLWLRDCIPGDGPWRGRNARSLRDKQDKAALQKLVRMGIYPLFIQDGGLRTTEVRKGGLGPWGGWTCRLWKQSKKRAVFEFAVPRARGWIVQDEAVMDAKEKARRKTDDDYIQFVYHLCHSKNLRRAARWRVAVSGQEWVRGQDRLLGLTQRQSKAEPDHSVPWEMGATSSIRAFLPFKGDRILRVGVKIDRIWGIVANWLVDTRLLTTIHVPVVRIEAPDSQYIELDKEILLIAQESGLDTDWDETLANFELRKAYRRAELDPVELLPADFLTIN
ncbi:hypothetical protein PMIN06_011298 [Paraphaeosphaeria minitans]